MDGVQAERTLDAAKNFDPNLENQFRKMYRWPMDEQPKFGPPGAYNAHIGLLARELCEKHGLLDRMPRYVAPGPLEVNKRLAEGLFLKTYELELEQAKDFRIWAYRKAAWTVDELGKSILDIYDERGEVGVQELPNIGKGIATAIGRWLEKYIHEENN